MGKLFWGPPWLWVVTPLWEPLASPLTQMACRRRLLLLIGFTGIPFGEVCCYDHSEMLKLYFNVIYNLWFFYVNPSSAWNNNEFRTADKTVFYSKSEICSLYSVTTECVFWDTRFVLVIRSNLRLVFSGCLNVLTDCFSDPWLDSQIQSGIKREVGIRQTCDTQDNSPEKM